MSATREWMKFIAGAVFWAVVTHGLLWASNEEPTVMGVTITTTISMYVVFVGVFAFVILASYGYFSERHESIVVT